jgi:hypothetical protein
MIRNSSQGAAVVRLFLLLVCCCWALVARAEAAPDANTIATIAGSDQEFLSLQAAIDAAPAGSTIELSDGRFDERVTITKSLVLVGAGTDATILGPPEEAQLDTSNRLEKIVNRIDSITRNLEQSQPRREPTPDETKEVRDGYVEVKQIEKRLFTPIVSIQSKANVELRSLRVTMPLTPREGGGLPSAAAMQVKDASLTLRNVAILGCMGEGIDVTADSKLEVDDCLVAACWGTGVSASHPNTAEVHIKNSDIRNNYHYNIGLGVESCVIEDCRISGTAWSGISCSGKEVRVERNALSHSSRAIYSVGQHGVVRNNLIYRNEAGASCWYEDNPIFEGNIFLENKMGGIYVAGPAEPFISKNLFVASPVGINYRPIDTVQRKYPYAKEYRVEGNGFWKIDSPLSVTRSVADDALPEKIELPVGNRIVDPQIEILGSDETLKIGNAELAQQLGIESMNGMNLQSRWPITPEEEAMIPENGSLDSKDWKMRPKR